MSKSIAIIGGKQTGSVGRHLYENLSIENIMLPDLDVRSEKQIAQFFLENENTFDGMVYSAGVYEYGSVKMMNLDSWEDTLKINLTGAMLCAKWYLRTQFYGGTLIFIGANAAYAPSPGSSAYCVSKAGLLMLTQTLAQENGPNYNFIQLDPGIIKDTNMYRDTYMRAGISEEKMLERRLKAVPAGRCMEKAEIVQWVDFLLKKGKYVNGVGIRVDGGKISASGKEK